MNLCSHGNRATISLQPGEIFFVKPSLLQGVLRYDWTLPPPYPLGSPFIRLYHHCWMLKHVDAIHTPQETTIYGNHPRGNFLVLKLKGNQKYYVSTRSLAGFSNEIRSIHTSIKIAPAFWLFHEHFFSVFEGPGSVLLYGASLLEIASQTEFQPSRIIAFDASKKFRPIAPSHRTLLSQIINILFSHDIIWQFVEPGDIIAETCSDTEEKSRKGFFWHFCKHLLGFFKV